jgi:MerR family transcriptional regulator, thiopeptide resistance regulator
MLLKIGELAKRTGLTVRALHHYDDIKLLCPSARSESGYRLYDRKDIERLHCIQALRRLDIPLADIATLLEGDTADLQAVIDEQIAALDRQVRGAMLLSGRLRALKQHLGSKEEPDLGEWLMTLEMMAMYDQYFTAEELERLRRTGLGVKPELATLVTSVRDLIARDIPPHSEQARALAKSWLELSLDKMAGDPRLMLKLQRMHRTEASVQVLTGVDAELLDYMIGATAEFRLELYARHLGAAAVKKVRDAYLETYPRWPALFAEARELHDRGAGPLGDEMLDLCRRWIMLFCAVWGTDPQVRERVQEAHRLEPDLMAGSGMTEDMMAVIKQGIEHLRKQQQEQA